MVAKGLITTSAMAGEAAAEEGLVASNINRFDLLRRGGCSPGKGAPAVVGRGRHLQ